MNRDNTAKSLSPVGAPSTPELPRGNDVATVTTLRAPYEVTLAFVAYHLNIGVDHLYLFFDDPADPAMPFFDADSRVTCFRCDGKYWDTVKKYVQRDSSVRPWQPGDGELTIIERQISNANLALTLARTADFEWLAHIDSDELLHAPEGLARALAATCPDVSVVRFQIREAIPSDLEFDHAFADISLFKVPSSRAKRALVRRLGCPIIYRGEYFRGHQESKCAVRCSADIHSMEIHMPIFKSTSSARRVDAELIALLHYDCMGFESWKKKWHQRTLIPCDWMRSNRAAQLEDFRAAWRELDQGNGERALRRLYRRMNVPSRWQTLLLGFLRMIEKIPLHPRLFVPPR